MSLIHFLAKYGKINALRNRINSHPQELEWIDKRGWTPIFHAARSGKKSALRLLLKLGADTTWSDIQQRNVVEIAKRNNKHNRISRYLRKKIGLSQSEKSVIRSQLTGILTKEFHRAKSLNKKLLVLLGELHGVFKIQQIQEIILAILSSLGMNHLCVEADDVTEYLVPIDHFAKHHLKFNLHAVDLFPNREHGSDIQRERVMADEINKLAKDAVYIVGNKHLMGLKTKIDLNTYHVLPLNLAGALDKFYPDKSSESQFAYDKKEVIQFKGCILTDANSVSAKWNPQPKKHKAGLK
ncbi:MAG: ankyrin repeat domain-containing protein [Candidatus Berkiella sp.]